MKATTPFSRCLAMLGPLWLVFWQGALPFTAAGNKSRFLQLERFVAKGSSKDAVFCGRGLVGSPPARGCRGSASPRFLIVMTAN